MGKSPAMGYIVSLLLFYKNGLGILGTRLEKQQVKIELTFGGARGVMVIVVGNGHGDTSSNPGRD